MNLKKELEKLRLIKYKTYADNCLQIQHVLDYILDELKKEQEPCEYCDGSLKVKENLVEKGAGYFYIDSVTCSINGNHSKRWYINSSSCCEFCENDAHMSIEIKACPFCYRKLEGEEEEEGIMDATYPTEEELQKLKDLAHDYYKVEETVAYIKELWHYADWGFTRKENCLELHTAGWSGNEEVIEVLGETLFWALYWRKSTRGGHYYFEIPKEEEY